MVVCVVLEYDVGYCKGSYRSIVMDVYVVYGDVCWGIVLDILESMCGDVL